MSSILSTFCGGLQSCSVLSAGAPWPARRRQARRGGGLARPAVGFKPLQQVGTLYSGCTVAVQWLYSVQGGKVGPLVIMSQHTPGAPLCHLGNVRVCLMTSMWIKYYPLLSLTLPSRVRLDTCKRGLLWIETDKSSQPCHRTFRRETRAVS